MDGARRKQQPKAGSRAGDALGVPGARLAFETFLQERNKKLTSIDSRLAKLDDEMDTAAMQRRRELEEAQRRDAPSVATVRSSITGQTPIYPTKRPSVSSANQVSEPTSSAASARPSRSQPTVEIATVSKTPQKAPSERDKGSMHEVSKPTASAGAVHLNSSPAKAGTSSPRTLPTTESTTAAKPHGERREPFTTLVRLVWSPLGVVDPSRQKRSASDEECSASSNVSDLSDAEHILCDLVSYWLREPHLVDRTARRQLTRVLWGVLHRTVFYCVNALTPSIEDNGDTTNEVDDIAERLTAPCRLHTPSQPSFVSTSPQGGTHQSSGMSRRPSSRRDASTALQVGDAGVTFQSWLFVQLCLHEMQYPREELLCQVPPHDPGCSHGNGPEATVVVDDVHEGASAPQELLLALLWLTKRYMLPAVAALVDLRAAAPFLFTDVEASAHRTSAGGEGLQFKMFPSCYPSGDAWPPMELPAAPSVASPTPSQRTPGGRPRTRTAPQHDVEEVGVEADGSSSRWSLVNRLLNNRRAQLDTVAAAAAAGLASMDEKLLAALVRPEPFATLEDDEDDALHAQMDKAARAVSSYDRAVFRLQRLLDNTLKRAEGLLLRRVQLLDVLGSSHNALDLTLCLPAAHDWYDSVTRGLRCWRDLLERAGVCANAAKDFMDILLSLSRRCATVGTGHSKISPWSLEGYFPDLPAAVSDDQRYETMLTDDASTTSSIGDIGEDRKRNHRPPPPVASVGDVVQRYGHGDAAEFYSGKLRWVQNWFRRATEANTQAHNGSGHHVASRDNLLQVAQSVQDSMNGRYSLSAAVAAELFCRRQGSASSVDPPLNDENDEDEVAEQPEVHQHKVLAMCDAVVQSSAPSAQLYQPVFVGPPAPGRTTSARVEIERLLEVLQLLTPPAEPDSAASQRPQIEKHRAAAHTIRVVRRYSRKSLDATTRRTTDER